MPDSNDLQKLPGMNPTGLKLPGTELHNTESAGGGNVEVLKNANSSYFDSPRSIFKEHDYPSTH